MLLSLTCKKGSGENSGVNIVTVPGMRNTRLGVSSSYWASLVAQLVKNPPAMQETWVRSLGWEDLLEKGKAYTLQYSGLENSMDCIVHGVTKSRTQLSDFHFTSLIVLGPVQVALEVKNPAANAGD